MKIKKIMQTKREMYFYSNSAVTLRCTIHDHLLHFSKQINYVKNYIENTMEIKTKLKNRKLFSMLPRQCDF